MTDSTSNKREHGPDFGTWMRRVSPRSNVVKPSPKPPAGDVSNSTPTDASTKPSLDLGLGIQDAHVVVTGGCGLIGRVVVEAFLAAGCQVTVLDIVDDTPFHASNDNLFYQKADISSVEQVDAAFTAAEEKFGVPEICVALASLDLSVLEQSESLIDTNPQTWQRVFDVNLNGTFITAQRWMRTIRATAEKWKTGTQMANVSLILMGSESGRFGVRTMAAYAAAKAAVQVGLLRSLAMDLPRIYPWARVNAIAPGAVDTERLREEKARYGDEWGWRECEATVPMAGAVSPQDVAKTILFLASENMSGGINGQLIPIDAGKQGNLVWTREELGEQTHRFAR